MVNINPSDEIIREPENYDDMIKKLKEREEEEMARASKKLGGDVDESKLLESAKKELSQLKGRRDFKPLSANEKEKKLEPADPHIMEVRNAVIALSSRIDTAIKQNPEANRAVLKGRVTLGKAEGKAHSRG